MPRLSKEDYIKIYKKYNVKRVWSFSRIETYKQDKYEYFLKYVKKIPGDRQDSAYAPYGTLAHDIIEGVYNKEIDFDDIQNEFDKKSLELEMLGKKFDRTDEQKNDKIKKDYEICIKDCLKSIVPPRVPFKTELPVVVDIAQGIVLIGYIDLIEIDNGEITITDFKTSTIYSKADMQNKVAQLMLYAEAIRKKKKLENFDNIQIQYNFLKYATVSYVQLNGKVKSRNIKRSEIGKTLSSIVGTFLKNEGYDEFDVNMYKEQVENTNSLNGLPKEIQMMFTILPCIVKIELSNEIIENFKKDIVETVHEIESKEAEYALTGDENVFWDEVDASKSFYFANLSEYSMNLHKPYKQYLVKNGLLMDTLQKQEQDNQGISVSTKNVESSINSTVDDKWKDMFGD